MQHYLAQNLTILRQKSNLSIEFLSRYFGNWFYWENGNLEPNLVELMELAGYFHLSLDALLKKPMLPYEIDISTIKLLLIDMDGVMTSGGMFYTEKGDRIKCFNAKDGLAIKRAIKTGLEMGIVSATEDITIVHDRAKALNINRIYVGHRPKLEVVTEWIEELGITFENVAYIGDDLNDLPVMQKVAIAACPNDAVQQVKDNSHIILDRKGGDACVRMFLEDVLQIPIIDLGFRK